jgi:hypothetical protein
MTTERILFTVAIAIWVVRWYLAQREIARLRDRAWLHQERAYHLHDFIKRNVPGALEQAEKMVAEKTAWRN